MKVLCPVLEQYVMILSEGIFLLKIITRKLWSGLRTMTQQLEAHTELSQCQRTHFGCSQEPKLRF